MREYPVAMLVCDRLAPGLPIIACNNAFVKLTGFDPVQVLGYNCREVLQGESRGVAT